jgi:alpha-L-fucosidase
VAKPRNWHETTFFGLHYDLHPSAKDTELGRETTYEHIRAELEKARPDFVQYDCKGHPGYTGYPTRVGTPSPGIRRDALKIWRQVTRDLGIPLSVHYSGTWDGVAQEQHPEWARMKADGTPYANSLCANKGYGEEYEIPQMLEIVREYDVDGFWVDGENWASHICWCETCRRLFTEQTGITQIPTEPGQPHWDEWHAFQRLSFERYVGRYVAAIHALKPTCMVCSNWMYSVRQPDDMSVDMDYLSGDFTPSWGAETALLEGKFIASRGKTWDLMAWAFLRVGDSAWAMKTAAHLSQECAVVMANGGNVFIYDVPKRSGRIIGWHQDILAQVARFCRQRKSISQHTASVPQVAILHSQSHYYHHNQGLYGMGEAVRPVQGALMALLESHYHVDILNDTALQERMTQYPAVVIPEQTPLPPALVKALGDYVQSGGRLLASGPQAAKTFGKLAGVKPFGRPITDLRFVPVGKESAPVAGPWQPVKLNGAKALAPLLSHQEPERDATSAPAVTQMRLGKGSVTLLHGPVFEAFARTRFPRLRSFIAEVMRRAAGPQMVELDGPPCVHLCVRQKAGKLLVHLYNLGASPTTSPTAHMVEDVPPVGPLTLRVRLPQAPESVTVGPTKTGLEWAYDRAVLTITLERLHIHEAVSIR